MSYNDGIKAIYLDMPSRVPRTEYSVLGHVGLIGKVTGIPVTVQSDGITMRKAQQAFLRAWNFDFMWHTDISNGEFGDYYTDMGHAAYAADGSDFRKAGSSRFKTEEDVFTFDPWKALGEKNEAAIVDRLNRSFRASRDFWDDGVNMSGVYITCMSGLIDLLGWDMLLTAAGTDPKRFGDMTDRYAGWLMQYIRALAKCDSPVIMIHDDITWTEGAFLRTEWYLRYIFPNYKRYLAPLLEAGKRVLFTSDGNYTAFIDNIADCGFHGFVMEPGTDMAYIAQKYGKTHVFIGNADTRILLMGTKDDIRREVKRCMDIGKKCPGFFMAVGNHIPANTPVDSALWYNEFYEQMSRR